MTNFGLRTVLLHDTDLPPHRALRFQKDPKALENFRVVPHEFGHALGYGNYHDKGEERDEGHRHFEDIHSIMNIGRRLRARHLFLVMRTLGHMVPAYTFSPRIES